MDQSQCWNVGKSTTEIYKGKKIRHSAIQREFGSPKEKASHIS